MAWTVHLIRRRPDRLPQISIVLLVIFALSVFLFRSFWLALLPVFVVLLSLSEYVFPIRYTLTNQSALARHGLTVLEIRWKDVRHAYLTDEGIKLSPLRAKNSRFEPLRGVLLRFNDRNQAEVIAAVQRYRVEENIIG